MSTLIERLTGHAETVEARKPVPCITPGCHHVVHEPWEESGLLCDECAIEGQLYDREARWDHVCPIPGTACLPCEQREAEKRELLAQKARARHKH